jgi:hypothetical protein
MDSRRDILMAVVVFILGVCVLWATSLIGDGVYRDSVGSKAFPYAVGILMTLGGAFLTGRRLMSMNSVNNYKVLHEGTPDEVGVPASAWRAAAVMATTIGYIAAMVPLGYLLATPLFIVVALYVMDERRMVTACLVAFVWTLITYLVFAQVLYVRLPLGPFQLLFRQFGIY